jgi:hypothetical protein
MLPVVATWLFAYALTGALIVLGVRLIWVACDHLPVWSLLAVLVCVAGLIGYTLWIRNVLAIIGLITVALAVALIFLLVWVPRVLPSLTDAVVHWWHTGFTGRHFSRTDP